jgi:hypothetical protein
MAGLLSRFTYAEGVFFGPLETKFLFVESLHLGQVILGFGGSVDSVGLG